jgi:hypothetical protein
LARIQSTAMNDKIVDDWNEYLKTKYGSEYKVKRGFAKELGEAMKRHMKIEKELLKESLQ